MCAGAGQLLAQGLPFTSQHVRAVLMSTWGNALTQRARAARLSAPVSNGQRAARRFGLRSAGDEAAQAFPVLFDVTLRFVQASARQFLQAGGVFQTSWLQHARAIHAACVARKLSPGGSADVLASACWVQSVLVGPCRAGFSPPWSTEVDPTEDQTPAGLIQAPPVLAA